MTGLVMSYHIIFWFDRVPFVVVVSSLPFTSSFASVSTPSHSFLFPSFFSLFPLFEKSCPISSIPGDAILTPLYT